MTITREQFIRGFNALKADIARRGAIEDLACRLGLDGFDLGSSPVATELERQLVERCRAREDENGPWPEDSYGEDDISLALHWESLGGVVDQEGNRMAFPTTPEGVWEMWEREKAGPFRPEAGR
jgi:hypothetical protein